MRLLASTLAFLAASLGPAIGTAVPTRATTRPNKVLARPYPPATRPKPRRIGWWYRRHRHLLAQLEVGPRVLFVGDSITERWRKAGAALWQKHYVPRRAINYGIGADETGHVLWRLQRSALERFDDQIEVVVLMIGTNNVYRHSAREVSRGIVAIVDLLQKKLPRTHVVVLAIFPRGYKPNIYRRKVALASRYAFARLRHRKRVHLLDIGARFLARKRRISSTVMPDYIHLSAEGYRRWTEAMAPLLSRLLCEGQPKTSPNPPSTQPTMSKLPRPDSTTLDQYDQWTREAAKRHRIDWLLPKAVRIKESFNDPFFVSTTGAVGLMQLMPSAGVRQHITAAYRAYLRARANQPTRRFGNKSARAWGLRYQAELLALVKRLRGNALALAQKDRRFDPRWNIQHGVAHLARDKLRLARMHPKATERQLIRMTLAAYYAGGAHVRYRDRRVVVPRYTWQYVADTLEIYCRLKRGLPGR